MSHMDEDARLAAGEVVRAALAEDLGARGDITSNAVIPKGLRARGSYVFRQEAVLAGAEVAEEVCRQISEGLHLTVVKNDGERVGAGEAPLEIYGAAADVLAAERTTINFLSHLSGVATLTRAFVDAVGAMRARIYDTRKTIPGLRALEKYAVRCGGGFNHRMGLFDQVLVKDNHLALMRRLGGPRGLCEALERIREAAPRGVEIEVEAKTLEEVEAAVAAGVDIVMLDNMPPEKMREAVAIVRSGPAGPVIEASGGVTLENVAEIAAAGVDRISVGALTHSAPAIDISLEIE